MWKRVGKFEVATCKQFCKATDVWVNTEDLSCRWFPKSPKTSEHFVKNHRNFPCSCHTYQSSLVDWINEQHSTSTLHNWLYDTCANFWAFICILVPALELHVMISLAIVETNWWDWLIFRPEDWIFCSVVHILNTVKTVLSQVFAHISVADALVRLSEKIYQSCQAISLIHHLRVYAYPIWMKNVSWSFAILHLSLMKRPLKIIWVHSKSYEWWGLESS